MNLWTVGCADPRLPTSFTAPPQQQAMNLIPGKVNPSAGYQPLLILPGSYPNDQHRRISQ